MSENTPLHVAVFMGGPSAEHEVSLASGRGAADALVREGYRVTRVVIGRDHTWQFDADPPRALHEAVPHLHALGVDCAFIALHGEFGEDGRIQGLLDMLQLPYTCSGVASSALAMDKVRCKSVVRAQGIRVAGHLALDRATWAADPQAVVDAVTQDIGFPCVVKPNTLGSSVGVYIPEDAAALEHALAEVTATAPYLMIEEYVAGRELTCSVLESKVGGFVRPLPITEIKPREGRFFDYHAKYTPGATEEITPAALSNQLAGEIGEIAVHVHEIVGCRIWSRSDFIVDEHGPVWIEVNTVPGLTPTSLYPQAAEAAGVSYDRLMRLFVEAAMGAAAQEQAADEAATDEPATDEPANGDQEPA